jgi:small subunit ribosomal protein S1
LAKATKKIKAAKPKAKPAKTKAEAPSAEEAAAASGSTNLGALLKAKMDSKK